MTFRDIALKNLKFNMRKFASFLFVNAFVVCVLFLFGSLLFNDILNEDAAIRAASSLIVMAAVSITVFSIIFLLYTGIYFIRSRGQEFGVYLTLGMNSRDLVRMSAIEGAVIFGVAALLGVVTALLIGKLFYLVLAKVLSVNSNLFFIGYETFVFSLGMLTLTFIIQLVGAIVFIRKLSIVEIMKATKTKGVARQRPLVGIAMMILFSISFFCLHAIVTGANWMKKFLHEYMDLSVIIVIAVMLISLFFLIGSAIAGTARLLQCFPKLYQRNILLLSGLGHKLRSYRVSLFSVTLLITFAVFFIGVGMSVYMHGKMTIDTLQPFDFMVERRGDFNAVSKDEVREVVTKAGGEIGSVHVLPYLDGLVYRELSDRDDLFINFKQNSFLVSESAFNQFTGQNIDVNADELLIVTNDEDAKVAGVNFNSVIVVESYTQGEERAEQFRASPLPKDKFLQVLDDVSVLQYTEAQTSMMFFPFVNSNGNLEFVRSHANVIADEVYEQLITTAASQTNELIALQLAAGDHRAVMDALLVMLKQKNNLPVDAWQGINEPDGKDEIDNLRPLSKVDRNEVLQRSSGFLLFAMSFLGLLFLASSFIVLYYRLVADTDEEEENIKLLKKIGLTMRECRTYLQTHMAIIFFFPLVSGGILGLYLSYQFFSAGTAIYAGYLLSRVALMYGMIALFGIFLYVSLRRRFFGAVRL